MSAFLLHLLQALIWGDSCYGMVAVVRTYREGTGRLTLSRCRLLWKSYVSNVERRTDTDRIDGTALLQSSSVPPVNDRTSPTIKAQPLPCKLFLIALPSDTLNPELPTVSCNNNEAKGTLLVVHCDISDSLAYLHVYSQTNPHIGWP